MPRHNTLSSNSKSSSGSRTSSNSSHKSITTTNSKPTGTYVSPTVPVSPISIESQKPSIISSVKDGIASGFGWGIGTSIARSIFGGTVSPNTNVPTNNITDGLPVTKCFSETENYKKCTEKFSADLCFNELEFLNKCKETIN